jgi:hypothetical protein
VARRGQRIKEMSLMPGTEHHPAMNPSKIALTLVTAEVAPGSRLPGRRAECARLDRLVADVRAGQSRVLVLRGGPGTGKTALLDYLAGRAAGCRLVRVAGMEPEIEFAFAGLHQLLAPMLDRLERLPGPQRDALRTVFGLSAGPAPERFLVALAVLSLLSEVARERPPGLRGGRRAVRLPVGPRGVGRRELAGSVDPADRAGSPGGRADGTPGRAARRDGAVPRYR